MTQTQQNSECSNKLFIRLIMEWLSQEVTTDSFMWLSRKIKRLNLEPSEKLFFLIFNGLPAKIGNKMLDLNESDLVTAKHYLPDWYPEKWTTSEAARITLILNISTVIDISLNCIEKILNGNKEDKVIAFYKGLPLYPEPDTYLPIAKEVYQYDNKNIIEALIHHNTYPKNYFNDDDWNKLIIYSLSLGCSLKPIIGLIERCNNNLSQELHDFIKNKSANSILHEVEMWQCLLMNHDNKIRKMIEEKLAGEDKEIKRSIIKACYYIKNDFSLSMLDKYSENQS